MMKTAYRKGIALLVSGLLCAAALGGCGGAQGPGGGSVPASGGASVAASQAAPAAGGASLIVWDTFTESAMSTASAQINDMFMEAFPGITIERVSKQLDTMDQTLKAAFMAGDAPDVLYHEMGVGAMGSYVQAGYLMNLADAYAEYGWRDTVSAVSAEVPQVDGFIYGVGSELETMSLYYNKTVYDELGLAAPGTVEELTGQFQIIKDAGYTPLANTMGTSWSDNMNFIGTLMYAYMSGDEIAACMNDDASWDLPSMRSAVATIADWLAKGYFPGHPEVDGEMRDFFLAQECVAWVTGNWSVAYINENLGGAFEAAIVPFPGSAGTPGGGAQVNFVGSGYMVSAQTAHQKEALDYVNYCINTPEAAVVWSEVGDIIPPYTGDYEANTSQLTNIIVGYLADEGLNNTAGINMWLGSNSFDFFSDAGQKLAVGALDVDSFIAEAEAARNADIQAGNTKGSFSFN